MITTQDRILKGRCLGKLPARIDPKLPTMRWLLDGANLSPVADIVTDWSKYVPVWPMLGNDKLGNCTIAALMHQAQLWASVNGDLIFPNLDCAISNYTDATGYDPATGANDNGAVELDILKRWMTTGFAIHDNGAFDLLDGHAFIDPSDIVMIAQTIKAFGTVYAGVELPTTADTEFENNQPWADLTGVPGSLGGHAVCLVDVNAVGPLCVTWARLQQMTWDWWLKYGSEAYAPLRRTWINLHGVAPSGLTMAQLNQRIVSARGVLGLGAL